ncbi:MAG: tRNA pseudouridine(38-40) synthase TruA [Eubacteriales bacterium]|nr:tRNA pseudouridine(38-40) synthase TruA [Eubacteriales bacterium]
MRNIKLTIEFDGTCYHGWQQQDNAISVQEVITKAIAKLTGEKCNLIGCGRTDAGVHALGFVANFHTESGIPPDKFSYALNSLLPDDISVLKSEESANDFHARFSATGKKYRYLIHNSKIKSAILRNRAYNVPTSYLDIEKVREAAQHFIGTHDFKGFMAAGSSLENTVRTIYSVSLEKKDDLITFEISGSGFLYNMVRIIAGTLIAVGEGKIQADEIPDIIGSLDRNRAGKTVPAHGLYLVEVYY